MTEEQLTALLRLKRYEQPPAGYYDQLLRDVQRRQRAELLRRPLWKIALERVQVLFSAHSMGQASYAGAMAAVLLLGLVAIGWLTGGGDVANSHSIAGSSPVETEKLISLETRPPAPGLALQASADAKTGFAPVAPPPRYMDARPVSYEPSSSFNF